MSRQRTHPDRVVSPQSAAVLLVCLLAVLDALAISHRVPEQDRKVMRHCLKDGRRWKHERRGSADRAPVVRPARSELHGVAVMGVHDLAWWQPFAGHQSVCINSLAATR